MDEALQFFKTVELWVYLVLGIGGIYTMRKFLLAWQELRGAVFGLERDRAQGRLNTSATVMVLIIALAIIEFSVVSFVAPAVPEAFPLLTPTLNVLATPTTTLPPPATGEDGEVVSTPSPVSSLPEGQSGCVEGQVMILSPLDGDEIRGAVPITGTADIPDFGFYKLEMKRPEETNWLTILAGNEVKQAELLGNWNTTLLAPGYQQLGLVVTNNQGQSLPACVIQVRIGTPEENP